MTTSALPNRIKASVGYVEPQAAVTGVDLCAATAYVRLSATVLLVNNHIEAFMADALTMAEHIAFRVGKALTDSLTMTEVLTPALVNGAVLDGVNLNASALNE